MRRFEIEQALRELGRRTPDYFRDEIFSHGDLKVRTEAAKVLKELEPQRRSTQILKEMLKLI